MSKFEQCIGKKIDITAYEPDSGQEVDEFLKILDHNHRVIQPRTAGKGNYYQLAA